jgi:hydroxypyruvate isomerase
MPNLATMLNQCLPMLRIAGAPSRDKPDREELNYADLFGYDGVLGCFRPFARS